MAKRTIKAPIIMRLKPNERKELKKLVTKGSAKAREIRRANILLMSDKKSVLAVSVRECSPQSCYTGRFS